MAQIFGTDEVESLRIELEGIGRGLRSSFHRRTSSCQSSTALSSAKDDADVEYAIQWAQIERLPTFERIRASLFSIDDNGEAADEKGKEVIDVTKLGSQERHIFIDRLIKDIENDNLRLLQKIRKRMDKVGVKFPAIEVRYRSLCVEAECEVVHGKAPLPTLWNSIKSMLFELKRLVGSKTPETKIRIINGVSGIIKPGRITLLLGPPVCGKSSLLKALSGNLDLSVKAVGEVSYNGHKLEEFVPQKTSAYISQDDLHISEMTVREIFDFSARCQGVGSRAEILIEVSRREKEAGIIPDPDIDTYMKAIAAKGLESNLRTDYVLKILGLDVFSETQVGDAMRRGLSGGQKRRVTAGEIIVGPTRALFMDEITNGLDSSTAFQVVACLQHFVHITDATILVSLLHPAPETFDLFDDLILMSEGKIVYHGLRDHVLEFFEDCGFRCPKRKGVADFLQEVLSREDQAQYWYPTDLPYSHVSVGMFSRRFMESSYGKKLNEELSQPYDQPESVKNALSSSVYSVPKWELFRACMSREFLLMKRNSFLYAFKTTQLAIIAVITMTLFLRTQLSIDVVHSTYYMGALFYALIILLLDGLPELAMTVRRFPYFYKQKQLCFYPAWAYAIPACIIKVPISLVQSLTWTCLTYYVIGYSPEVQRFFGQFFLLFAVNLTSTSMFRFLASVFQTNAASTTAGSFAIYMVILFGGFIITHPSMPGWLKWSFWVSPLTYGEIGISLNEFLSPRWQKMLSSNTTIGRETLVGRGLDFHGYLYWMAVAALFGFTILFNVGFALALSYRKSPRSPCAIISPEKWFQINGRQESTRDVLMEEKVEKSPKTNLKPTKARMVLPFTPLAVVFQDVQYYVDTPLEMREQGFVSKKLQLLCDVTGSLRPGVLTALMGVSGAGKTTLLDVLAGRKTSGHIKGQIMIGGCPKVQETFTRVVGYCEQTDTHSPQITVEESLKFSAWLRLSSQIDSKTKAEFVNEVLETIDLDGIKDALVGIPGVSGLSTEQRKRLTIAVELVSNPSIIFIDEPTSVLDARAAAIAIRAVKNIVDTGRTIVCTIHQPSIEIFESFDELIVLKRGGRIIYSGPLGPHSSKVIKYFESIPGVPRIRNNYNPATWMLEATSMSVEAELGVDFAQIYRESTLFENNKELVRQLSSPPPGSKDLHFQTKFAQNSWGQFKSCLWKQHLSYWRNPSYNLMRIMYTLVSSFVFGTLFWKHGKEINNQQDLLIVLGSMYATLIFLGINNCSSVLPIVATERNVMRRERFAGMYAWWAYPLAQVIVELPYLLIQAFIFGIITYPMIGYNGSAYKIFWYFYTMFCSLLFFNYLGMLLVSITPNSMVSAIITSALYPMFNLFSGFLIPRPRIPKWWIWLYYLAPTSWSLNSMFTSQYGDIDKEIVAFGETTTVAAFVRDYCGYHRDQLPLVEVVLIVYPLVLAVIFAYCIDRLNFQRR